jgi:hypothetical protein
MAVVVDPMRRPPMDNTNILCSSEMFPGGRYGPRRARQDVHQTPAAGELYPADVPTS